MLDFHALATQLEKMLDDESLRPSQIFQAVEAARELCAGCDGNAFNEIVARALQSDELPQGWHPARLFADESQPSPQLCTSFPPPPQSENLCVVAADGSQIYPDAHQIDGCYLINVSGVQLRYGASTRDGSDNAQMLATPQLFGARDAWGEAAREVAGSVNKELVDARRHILELSQLSKLLNALPQEEIAVGMCDGIFELRVSAAQPWRQFALDENERQMDALRLANQPVCGYIAAPRATDVVTALRLVQREYSQSANPDDSEAALSLLSDARLFDALLEDGERSAVFVTTRMVSPSQREYARDANDDVKSRGASTRAHAQREDASRHASCFCYLKIAANQVVRLEFPRWVATRLDWLEWIHAALLQQIEKGDGYPVALMEAHEHAVVRASERELFYNLLEEMMTSRGHNPQRSAKAISKTRPLV